MNKYFIILAISIAGAAFGQDQGKKSAAPPPPPFTIMVSGYSDGAEIPIKFTCANAPAGESPAISWKNVPMGTASFVMLLHDPEGHPGKGMYDVTHWLVFNIPGTATELPSGVQAATNLGGGIQAKGVRGNMYFGPCAPPTANPHHYTFELFALDSKLDLSADAGRPEVMKAMDGHVLGAAEWVGLFKRPQ